VVREESTTFPPVSFFGQVTFPDSTFLIYVTGVDSRGSPFQRALPGLISSQSIRIISPLGETLQTGQNKTYQFVVENHGASDTFTFTAVDDRKFGLAVSPITFALDTNASQNVSVMVSVPAIEREGPYTLKVRVAGSGTTAAHNFASLRSYVTNSTNQPPVAVVVPMQNASFPCCSNRGAVVKLDGSGSSDPAGDSLAFEWKSADTVIGSGPVVNATLFVGNYTFVLTVTDSAGHNATANTTVVVSCTKKKKGGTSVLGGAYSSARVRDVR